MGIIKIKLKMVFENHIEYKGAAGFENEFFRARHGYKDAEAHDPPYRRSRDFKPVPYGSAKGILNYRHSEPFALLKNMRDLPRETHHFPITMSGHFLKGGLVGTVLGSMYFLAGPVGQLETEKVLSAAGSRAFSGKLFRILKQTGFRYFLMGGTALSGYHMLMWYMRHHDEANPRPIYIDHTIALTVLTTGASLFVAPRPWWVGITAFFSVAMLAPFSWWLLRRGTIGA